ncbi:MAG: tetratricopeptide repeat protein [Kiritimatiellae bacterium]|nr:tetratricopeptide repeat protein [Kiritimatiellia bacterium]
MAENQPHSSQPAGPARSLYHKERPATRSRMESRLKAPPSSSTPPLSAQPEHRPGKQLLFQHVRTLALVLVGMFALLVLSMAALRGIWAAKDRELRASVKNVAPTETAQGTNASPAATPADSPTTAVGVASQVAPSLDTERIRRADFLAKHAKALEESGLLTDAIARYREALEVWPNLNTAWAQLGRAYLKMREFAKAQVALEKAVQAMPNSAELMNDLGASLLYQGQIAPATRLFDAAAEIDPDYALSHFNLALCRLAMNDRAGARTSLQAYLRMKPTDARALREMAYLDALETQYEAAMTSLQKALKEAPDWALLYFDAAAVSALMGRLEQAILYLQKAEPLSSPRAVYQIYREPAFREIHLTELGKEFEHDLANRARALMTAEIPQEELHPTSEPLLSTDPAPVLP